MSKTRHRGNEHSAEIQSIEQLKQRFDKLAHERTRVEERLATTTKQLAEMREQAKAEFGTDDVQELEKQLIDIHKENDRKRLDYQKQLDQIEARLEEIDAEFADAEFGED